MSQLIMMYILCLQIQLFSSLVLKDRDGTIKGGLTISVSFNGRTHSAPFRGYGYVPLRNGGNVVRRMGTQQQSVSFCLLSPL